MKDMIVLGMVALYYMYIRSMQKFFYSEMPLSNTLNTKFYNFMLCFPHLFFFSLLHVASSETYQGQTLFRIHHFTKFREKLNLKTVREKEH